MVSGLDSGLSSLALSSGWDHGVVFMGKALSSQSASHHPGVFINVFWGIKFLYGWVVAWGNPVMD